MAAPIYFTADMVRALPEDGNRYETVQPDVFVAAIEEARTSFSTPTSSSR